MRDAITASSGERHGFKGMLALLAALSTGVATAAEDGRGGDRFAPLPPAPTVDVARAELGRLLFFDTRLSGDTATSCASCHDPAQGWGDGQALSAGYTGVRYFRNSPGLFNVAHRPYLTRDARLDGADLGTLVRDMVTDAHTMNADGRLVQERLKQVPKYAALFEAAFGPGDPYGPRMFAAVGEFLKTIRTKNAPFDRHLAGDEAALTAEQTRGMNLFAGKAGCAACHHGPMLSDGGAHATGVPEHPELATDPERQIAMLRHFASLGTPNYMNLRRDVGLYAVTKEEEDIGRFATPPLWDVGQTAPYMHNGVFDTLEAVIDFYDAGGGERSGLAPLGLTATEKADLVAFLESLTGDAPDITPPESLPDYEVRPWSEEGEK